MKNFLTIIKNSIIVLWNRHRLLVPPKYWIKYLSGFFKKVIGKTEYYNPFSINEYNAWLKENQNETSFCGLDYKPLISFIIPVYNIEREFLTDCLNSILQQSYDNFEICLADDHSTNEDTIKTLKEFEKKDKRVHVVYRKENGHISASTNSALEIVKGEYVALMDDDDTLTKDALYEVVKAINKNRNIDFIYSDEDKATMEGVLCEPHFKPDFSLDSFFGGNYICHFTVIKKQLFDKIGNFSQEYVGAQDFDLFLRATEQAKCIYHIPKILYHWRKVPGSTADTIGNKMYAIENGKAAVEASLKRRNLDAYITVPIKSTHYVVHYNVKTEPLVSIILTDLNNNYLSKNLKQIYENTNYTNYEIIVLSNKKLKKIENITFLNADIDTAINNSKGEYIVIISGLINSKNENWLKEMIGYSMQKNIGMVGPKLITKKIIRSAGLILSNDFIYAHAFKDYDVDFPGFYGRLLVPYNYLAIACYCVAFEKRKYKQTCGYEKNVDLMISNIDICLELNKLGYRNVVIPHVSLNSKSLKMDNDYKIKNKYGKYLISKWDLDNNIYYNENFSKKFPFMLDRKKK